MYVYIYVCRDILKWGILESPLGINNDMVQSWPFWDSYPDSDHHSSQVAT